MSFYSFETLIAYFCRLLSEVFKIWSFEVAQLLFEVGQLHFKKLIFHILKITRRNFVENRQSKNSQFFRILNLWKNPEFLSVLGFKTNYNVLLYDKLKFLDFEPHLKKKKKNSKKRRNFWYTFFLDDLLSFDCKKHVY